MFSLSTGLVLGLLLGMRHALEPDHLAAVSTLIARRGNPRAGAVLGAFWGLGHTLALFSVGGILAALDARLPPSLADGFELLVALMLLVLGARAVHRATRTGAGAGDRSHDHHSHDVQPGKWTIARQPLLVGLVHGLAGSGALTALVVASLPTVTTRLVYIALFGLGSIAGMACLTGIAGWPLARMDRGGRLFRWVSAATGTFSVLLGAAWAWSVLRGFGPA
jgi:protein-S-isoprenylcysteine O-methyltransferase Ste14